MPLVFVYGTLKSGHHNHKNYLSNLPFVDAKAPGFDLHSGPGFPYAFRGKGTIIGELYDVDDKTFKRLDTLEGYPFHYGRIQTEVLTEKENKKAWIYFSGLAKNYPKIESGIWSLK